MHIPLTLLAAGSLRRAFLPLLARFTDCTGKPVNAVFGPAGLLREQIESDAPCSVFASANRQHPQTLSDAGLARDVRVFAHNSLILTVRNTPQTAGKTWLELLSDPALRLGTSTPLSDPCADYTWQLFDNIDLSNPGLGRSLKQRAKHVVGGRHSRPLPPGVIASNWLICEGVVDLFVGYAHYARTLQGQDAVRCVTIPEPWNICCEYALAKVDASDAAHQLYQFILGEEGQRYLQDAGFMPVGARR